MSAPPERPFSYDKLEHIRSPKRAMIMYAYLGISLLAAVLAAPSGAQAQIEEGLAVWTKQPGITASGEKFDPKSRSAGHRTLPLGTVVRVTNRENGRSALVKINDRGPIQKKFVIDLSQATAEELGFTGIARVAIEVLSTPGSAMAHRGQLIAVSSDEPKLMNMALNKATEIATQAERREDTMIEIVACGPGLHMLRRDTSPVQDRIAVLAVLLEGTINFTACSSGIELLAREDGREITLVPEARMVPSGFGRVVELQDQGWTYVPLTSSMPVAAR
jgi:rare lipoprotein A (peptidoglycan hydrolase)